MNDSIKRVQSQAGLSFAERENQRSAAGGKANLRPEVKQKDFMKSAGRRGYSPLARVMTLAVMLLTMATTGAWAGGKTVDFPIGNDDNTGWGGSMTRNGIKIQANGSNALFDNSHPTAIFECWQGEEYVTFTISMEDGSDILGVSMTLSGDYIGSFQNLEGWTGSEATRTWSGNAKSVNLRVNGSSEETINLEVTAISVTVPAAAEPGKYTVTMAEGAGEGWTIAPAEATTTGVDKDTKITATYSGTKHVKSVTAVTKAAAPAYTMAAAATDADKGKLICADGHIHANGEDAECTAARVAKIIYIGTTGHATYTHGLALALTDEGQMAWEAAKTACNTTKNTSTPVTDATWLLASKDQWNYMLNGAGGTTSLRDGFSGITGASNLTTDVYWSSTESASSKAWGYGFSSGDWYSSWNDMDFNVRACLAF